MVWANQLTVDLVSLSSDSLLHGSRLEDFILDPYLNSDLNQDPFEVEDESFFMTC